MYAVVTVYTCVHRESIPLYIHIYTGKSRETSNQLYKSPIILLCSQLLYNTVLPMLLIRGALTDYIIQEREREALWESRVLPKNKT